MFNIYKVRHLKSINELVKNKQSIKWHLNRSLSDLNDRLSQKITKNDVKVEVDRPVYYKIMFLHTPEKDHQIWMEWLKNVKLKLYKEDIIVSYKDYKKTEQEFIGDDFETRDTGNILYDYIVYLKNIHTNRIKPGRYVYHYSDPKYRKEIQKNGLKAKSHTGSQDWGGEIYLEYPEAVFAVNSDTDIWKVGDRWRIDTTKIKNAWWEDLNFSKRPDLVMTFSDIPKEAIELVGDKVFESKESEIFDSITDYLQDIFDKYDIPHLTYSELDKISHEKGDDPDYKFWTIIPRLHNIDEPQYIYICNLDWKESDGVLKELKSVQNSLEKFVGRRVTIIPKTERPSPGVESRLIIIRPYRDIQKWD